MPAREPEIVTLIRLRQGSLPPAEGLRLRELMAMKEGLRIKWRLLSESLDRPAPVVEPADLSEESIAAFVDSQMTSDEVAEFEARCWSDPALIAETAAACAARFTSLDDIDVPASITSHMQELLRQHLSANDEQSSGGFVAGNRIGSSSTAPAIPTRRSPQNIAMIEPAEKQLVTRPGNRTARPQKSGRLTLIVATLALTAIILGWFALPSVDTKQDSLAEQPLPSSPEPVDPKDPGAADPQIAEIPNRESLPPVETTQEGPNTPTLTTDTVRTPLQPMTPDLRETPTLASEQAAKIVWRQISGVLLSYDRSTERWRGIQATSDSPKEPEFLMTLPNSWAAGEIDGGTRIVLDADTEAIFKVSIADAQRVSIDIHRGRTAIEDMKQGDILTILDEEETWPVQVDQDGTAVGLELSESGLDLNVMKGAVTVHRTVIGEGFGTPLKADALKPQRIAVRPPDWWQRPSDAFPLAEQFLQELLESPDVLATLDASKDVRTQPLMRRLALAIDPITRIGDYANAANETDRLSAIEWLIHASPADQRYAAAWVRLEEGPLQNTNGSVRSWYASARQSRPASINDLQQLVTGLGPQQPLFVRQSAIYFLRLITGRPLREYAPDQPTRMGINAVAQQVRQFQTRRR